MVCTFTPRILPHQSLGTLPAALHQTHTESKSCFKPTCKTSLPRQAKLEHFSTTRPRPSCRSSQLWPRLSGPLGHTSSPQNSPVLYSGKLPGGYQGSDLSQSPDFPLLCSFSEYATFSVATRDQQFLKSFQFAAGALPDESSCS